MRSSSLGETLNKGSCTNFKLLSMKNENGKKLLVLLPGLGAVSTTFLAGIFSNVFADKKIIGSITQNYKSAANGQIVTIADLRNLPKLENLTFAAWDITSDNAYEVAKKVGALNVSDIDQVKEQLMAIKPMAGVFSEKYISNLEGSHIKKSPHFEELVEQLRADIRDSKAKAGTDNAIMVYCASTERFSCLENVHMSLASFEQGLKNNDEHISPSQLYAYAALLENVPFANGTPNLTVEIPALLELAQRNSLPVAGKDFKTGQTFLKTLLAPGLKAKLLGVNGWFSTNILGNKDGYVLNEPENFKSKESTKLKSLDTIFDPDTYPELYKDLYHMVKINYYPPRGDAKEGWDNIDIFGWMNYPMQIKINFLCRDSILAAPIVLDLALLLHYSKSQGYVGIQDWMSFYFKLPYTTDDKKVIHSLMTQHENLLNELTSPK